ncbi:MAG: phenylalanine--tRNA ligase subunit beta [Acidobacteria bacterium]|nr:phenylalanine--tRNA ligase subunit beta [Acidobacteriota bacterium]MBI3656533.1 phenylalanine--tRNA ligase subunit beta [Acidobacteriota bacterium]
MKINFTWLKEYVEITASAQELRRALTMVGLAAEALTESEGNIIIEMDVTSNRPDCLNHLGVAREVAAIYNSALLTPAMKATPLETETETACSVEIASPRLCARYSALLMTDIQVGPSPPWLQTRLISVGQRPLNNIVDITNYVLLELGHPLHSFDFEKLEGGKIIVRAARPHETLVTLDGIARTLDPSMLVIADANQPVALAGIMGGLDSAIDASTRTLLLESAFFNPTTIRRTARQLTLSTEASYRFERQADIGITVTAIQRAAHLIREIAGGKVCGPLIDVHAKPLRAKTIVLRQKRAEQLIGVSLDPAFIEDKLTRLGFRVKRSSKHRWKVVPPSFRVDVGIEADLIEEIARHHGYDRVPATIPAGESLGRFAPGFEKEQIVCSTLKALGFYETINWSFIGAPEAAIFHPPSEADRPAIKIGNPISEVDAMLRTTTLPSLLKVLRWNFNHDLESARVFELGRAFFLDGQRSGEYAVLGLALTGAITPANWQINPQEVSFSHLKGAVSAVLDQLRLSKWEIIPVENIPFFHPYIGARIEREGRGLGILGRLHPRLEAEYKFKQAVFLAELDLRAVFEQEALPVRYTRLPRYPAVWHDVSLLVEESVVYGDVERAIRSAGISALQEVFLSDLYRGAGLPLGKKSLSVRLTYQDPERTLTADEAMDFTQKIRSMLIDRFGAELR